MKNKNGLILVSIIVICVVSIGILIYLLIGENNNETSFLYGTVIKKGSNYIEVESVDKESFIIHTDDDFNIGDFVSINYKGESNLNKGDAKIDLILGADDALVIEDKFDTQTTTQASEGPTSSSVTTITTSKKSTVTNSNKTTMNITTISENELVAYVKDEYTNLDTNDASLKDKAKNTFITVVDFIFYDGEIKGRKFNELTGAAKAKIVYYALLLDSKIDSKWPNYKEELQTKYDDIKAKLLAKYMDITTSVCANNENLCTNLRGDFNLLKKSVSLTWDVLKNAFSYAYNKGTDALINWYEIFSGKK